MNASSAKRRVVFLFILLLAATGRPALLLAEPMSMSDCPVEKDVHEGLNYFLHDGYCREFLAHYPEGVRSPPTVLVLHNNNEPETVIETLRAHMGLDALADAEGMAVIYPKGIDGRWNDGRPPVRRGLSDDSVFPDDNDFLYRLVTYLSVRGDIDGSRLFVLGASNGGIMALRMMCESRMRFRAVAVLLANMPRSLVRNCSPKGETPLLFMNGTQDPFMPWSGGHMLDDPELSYMHSTSETVEFWRRQNGCFGAGTAKNAPDPFPENGTHVRHTVFDTCAGDGRIELYALVGYPHAVPVSKLDASASDDIDAATVVVDFFKRYK